MDRTAPNLKPLYSPDGPLVWIDCEMTGLDPHKDKILEIAVRVSNPRVIFATLVRC